jgi:protein-S-isoprenylcysteine O-methyltransferase Ste14
MSDLAKNFGFFLLFVFVYQTIIFLIFVPEIYLEPIYVIYLIMCYMLSLGDTLLRPIAKKENPSKIFDILMMALFLLNPFFLIAAYYENMLLITPYLSFWNNLIIPYIGFCLYLAGGIIVIIARVELGRFATGDLVTDESQTLFTQGVYNYIRNPIYAGGLLGVIGFALVFKSILTLLIISIVYFIVFNIRIKEEERLLKEKFGEQFDNYKKRTKKLIPYIY